jgi:hypothetical protein
VCVIVTVTVGEDGGAPSQCLHVNILFLAIPANGVLGGQCRTRWIET